MSLGESSPPYSSSAPAPCYSREPSAEEERLAFTRSGHPHQPDVPLGNFQKRAGRITLTLHEQDEKAQVPLYEKNSVVSGTIALDDPARICSVVIKVRPCSCRNAYDLFIFQF
jgi:hypothetical protein